MAVQISKWLNNTYPQNYIIKNPFVGSLIIIAFSFLFLTIYFTAFLVEIPAQRWNLSTFFDSCKYTFLIGIIPFAFFTIINYRYLLVTDIE